MNEFMNLPRVPVLAEQHVQSVKNQKGRCEALREHHIGHVHLRMGLSAARGN